MKTKYLFLIALIFLTTVAFSQSTKPAQVNMMLENQSKYGFDETIDLLSKTITENNWRITNVLDMQETMKKNGKEVRPVKVIEMCNPNYAFKLLSNDSLLNISNMLPCRISVYEKLDGFTYISRMNAGVLVGMINSSASETLLQAFNDSEEIVKVVLP